jgi:hypothetical protein
VAPPSAGAGALLLLIGIITGAGRSRFHKVKSTVKTCGYVV